jgi:large subunit ribosomal protein L1
VWENPATPLLSCKEIFNMAKKHGKKYIEAAKLVDKKKKYSIDEAVELVKKVSYTKFPATVELHIKTTADPRYQDQMIRGTVVLPHGTGKTVRVAAFVSDDRIKEAQEAGADIVGNQDLIEKIQKGEIDFDVLVTTPDMMRELAKVAKIL